MVDTPQFSGAPITINSDDGSAKVYDAGLLAPEAQQAVVMLAFINQFRQVLNTSSQVFSNVVTENLIDDAVVEEINAESSEESEDDTTTNEETKDS
jgi:hypothetical protein|tara:strand:+ start:492 stop:779 length:288 start_codon:yes stop_codon:yes gene_type:complete